MSAGAGPPSPQTEPQLHHSRKTEEGPRRAERAFQTSCALMLSAGRETHRPLWKSFKDVYSVLLKDREYEQWLVCREQGVAKMAAAALLPVPVKYCTLLVLVK